MDSKIVLDYIDKLQTGVIDFAPKLLAAVVTVYIGFWVVKKLSKIIGKTIKKAGFEIEIAEFLISIIDMVLRIVVIAIGASIVGVKFTALFGLLAAAGFAVGMALQGFLGNFASGLTILFFKPYRVGDWVSISDSFGKVESIQIFNTLLVTPNDKTLVIPNGQVTDNIITNYSTKGKIRLELNVMMPYEESFPRVEQVISKSLASSEYILKGHDTLIGIESYDSHNIVLAIRPYINPDHYWEAKFEVYGLIKKAFSENNIRAAYSEGVELGPIGN